MMQHVGVDGCRAGWLAVTRESNGLKFQVCQTIDELASEFRDAERILIDVPIGLPWSDTPIRPCDRLARTREVLGRLRQSSVFPVPCREALAADRLEEARRINQLHIGRGMNEQTFGILPKIREVDRFLLSNRTKRHYIREVHPEVCFWALAGRPMTYSKKTVDGQEERLKVLQCYEPAINNPREVVRSIINDRSDIELDVNDIKVDDVLDATVAFLTAEACCGRLTSLFGNPSHDLAGLPMEMVYLRMDQL